MTPFDILVLTAANEAQAQGYRAQLAWRQENGLLDSETRALVVTDPGGRRVGSLGATLNVLAVLAEGLPGGAGAFRGRRVLVCHSGGDSRRTPAYAAQGKVFTPVPATGAGGAPLALFDLILQTVSALPVPEGGQVLVTSGDVLLTFDHGSVDFSRQGVTGVAYFGPAERGSRHGVYVPEAFRGTPLRTECVAVADFLQKPSEAEVRACGAVDPFGHVAVDTGLLSLDPETCGALLKVARAGLLEEIADGRCPSLDLYEELTMALASRFGEERFLERFVASRGRDRAHLRRMRAFYRGLRGVAFHVNIVPYCEFFHIGSSRELLGGFSGLSRTAQEYRFANGSGACVTGGGETEQAFLFNARVACPLKTGNALIEGVHAAACAGIALEGDNILTGLPPEASAAVRLPKGVGLVCLPVGKSGWAAVAYGLEDDFKTPFGGAKACRFLNAPVEEWLARNGVPAARLWKGDEKDGMWRARLWRVGAIDAVLAEAVGVAAGGGMAAGGGRRHSLAELLPRVDHGRLLAVRQEIRRQVNVMGVAERLLRGDALPSAEVCGATRRPGGAGGVRQFRGVDRSRSRGRFQRSRPGEVKLRRDLENRTEEVDAGNDGHPVRGGRGVGLEERLEKPVGDFLGEPSGPFAGSLLGQEAVLTKREQTERGQDEHGEDDERRLPDECGFASRLAPTGRALFGTGNHLSQLHGCRRAT